MMKESAADIIKYKDIIDGTPKNTLPENEIHLGIDTQGVLVGETYLFDNGIRWATVVEEVDDHWLIESGLIEYAAEIEQYISKHEISTMIRSGEMVLEEIQEDDILAESCDDDNEFNAYMEKVDRYLLVNYMTESQDLDYAWKVAWAEGKQPAEASEEALIEGN